MTYGQPSLANAGRALGHKGVRRILVLPLYPQYSAATTGAVFDGLAKALQRCPDVPELHFIRDYWEEPRYLDVLADSIRQYWQQHGQPDRLLLSFHGIPSATRIRAIRIRPCAATPPRRLPNVWAWGRISGAKASSPASDGKNG